MSASSIKALIVRVETLERRRYSKWASRCAAAQVVVEGGGAAAGDDDDAGGRAMRRARSSVEAKGIFSAVWRFVPEPYYTWPLEQRAACLGAASIQYLCKSLLMENRKAPPVGDDDADSDPTNPRFLLVVIQYAAALDVKKLATTVRALRKDATNRLDDSQFDFRIASEEDNRRITGYEHNSVTPFGINKPVPIVVSAVLEPLRFFWMGGGHVHLKLGMAFTEFCLALNPIVADVSHARTTIELKQMDMGDL